MSCGCSDCEYIRELEAELDESADARDMARRGWADAEQKLAAANARIEKAITWLVTVKADHPAGIIAERARLALGALRDPLHAVATTTLQQAVAPSSRGNYSLAELRRIVRADESALTASELLVRSAMLEMLNQPAAPSRTEHNIGEFGYCNTCKAFTCTPRTEAEQAVLDAMHAVATTTLQQAVAPRENNPLGKLHEPCEAELARRGLK